MSEAKKKIIGEKHPRFGKRHSEETKRKLSRVASERKGEKNSMFGKKRPDVIERSSKTYVLISPFGEYTTIKNLAGFCRENNFDYSCMLKVYNGKSKSSHGWTKYSETDPEPNERHIA